MQKFMKSGLMAVILAGLFLVGCDDNEALKPVEGDVYAAEMTIEEGMDESATVFVNDLEGATTFDVLVKFISTDKKIRRVYMTKNLAGAGSEPYELTLSDLDKKADGSLDVSNKTGKEFEYVIPFNVLSSLTAGTEVYQIWTTDGRGDYRDPSNSAVSLVGTLTVNYGGSNPATAVKEFTATILAAPLADGSSATFVSLIDGTIFKINQGEEYVAFWDFGYYYGATGLASLASTSNYPTSVIDIPTVASTTADVLNHVYFAHSDIDFAAVTNASDLSSIVKSDVERLNQLAEGDILEFVDNYGKKGVIKVAAIVAGSGSNGKITLDIKVQP